MYSVRVLGRCYDKSDRSDENAFGEEPFALHAETASSLGPAVMGAHSFRSWIFLFRPTFLDVMATMFSCHIWGYNPV